MVLADCPAEVTENNEVIPLNETAEIPSEILQFPGKSECWEIDIVTC
jgi:hypothetical protein